MLIANYLVFNLCEQVLHKIQDDLKARTAELHDMEETNRKLVSERASLEEKLLRLQRKNADEVRIPDFLYLDNPI